LKYFVLAGEASGDKQAALLCEAIYRNDPGANIIGWGGEAMEGHGVKVTRHYRALAYMGFVEVVKHLPAIFRNFRTCKEEILAYNPDALVLIDYPGFNLRMAVWAHKYKIPVYYYISPQLWAWHTSRVKHIIKAVRRMYVILPFEKEFYQQYGVEVMYIGHPLAVEIKREDNFHYAPVKGRIALLPGSRKHEVERILPEMASLARRLPEHTFCVAAVPHLSIGLYAQWLSGLSNIEIISGDMKKVLGQSEAAIVTSGTATLETALLGVPQIVVYKGSPLSYQVAKRLIKVRFISLVNLIMDIQIVPELIQADCNAAKMHEQLLHILTPSEYRHILEEYKQLGQMLTAGGGAEAAALDIISDLGQSKK
jgi:lipid-A-disaccharide synthase